MVVAWVVVWVAIAVVVWGCFRVVCVVCGFCFAATACAKDMFCWIGLRRICSFIWLSSSSEESLLGLSSAGAFSLAGSSTTMLGVVASLVSMVMSKLCMLGSGFPSTRSLLVAPGRIRCHTPLCKVSGTASLIPRSLSLQNIWMAFPVLLADSYASSLLILELGLVTSSCSFVRCSGWSMSTLSLLLLAVVLTKLSLMSPPVWTRRLELSLVVSCWLLLRLGCVEARAASSLVH